MKALVYTAERTLEYKEVPEPVLADEDNLIEIKAVGICGSDMHAYLGHDERRPAPLILGHEAAGIVLKGPMEGKRVTIRPLVTCKDCEACKSGRANLCAKREIISMPPREGAFAERIAMPSGNLVEMGDDTTFEQAALAEPIAVCWHAVRLGNEAIRRDPDTTKCLVIGGGPIGLGSALSLKAKGFKDITIIEPNEARRKVLKSIGDFQLVDSASNLETGYQFVVDAVGFSVTRSTASKLAAPGGVIVHIGLGEDEGGLDIRRMTLQEITFIGTYTFTEDDFKTTAQHIFDGSFGDLSWTLTMPLSEGNQAFQKILNSEIASPKIILIP